MDHIYHSFEELPTPDETGEVIGYTTGGQPEADGAEPNFNDDDGECKALYQKYTDEKHPKDRWDIALWACSFDDWKFDYGAKYSGPYADRTGEMYRLHDTFIEKYLKSRNLRGWRKKDGSEIKNPLVDVLDAYETWRKMELAKPAAERACEFGADGFPVKTGQFEAFIEAVKCGTACYSFDCRDPYFNLDIAVDYWVRFAVRDLVPSGSGWEEPSYWQAHPDELYSQKARWLPIPGLENDEQLLPEGFADYARARLKEEGEDDPWGNRRS